MDNADISVVVPVNDLESEYIARWSHEHGFHTVALDLPWGSLITAAHLDLKSLKRTVLLVELPSPELEDQLRRRGKIVRICDQHLYPNHAGGVLDRRNPLRAIAFGIVCG